LAGIAAALVLISAGAGAGIAYLSRSAQGSTAGLAASPAGRTLTTSQIAAAVDPAVVDINTNLGEGTGMIATSNGEIITNNHVVEDASTIKVLIDKGGTYNATVVGTDATADVAVLQIKGVSGLPTVTFGNSSSVNIGDPVVAIGNAGGQGFPSTVTAGAVTALHRTIMASNDTGSTESLANTIQMDALIEPGNSGGPLVNSSGRVIGMDTAAASADGATPIGFALPINQVLQVANDIMHGKAGHGIVIGYTALLGIEGQAVSLGSGSATGVGLELVNPGSPAALAGIQEGDVIVAFDGHSTPTLAALATLIHKLRPGDRAEVTFDSLTGGTDTVTVTLAAAPPA
jgi:S1-C subfamily serine protease